MNISRVKAVDALFIQAGIAASLSFSHIHDIAQAAGQGTWQAWAYPISVDLLLFAAWRRIRAGRGGAKEWTWFTIALAASLGANLATADLMVTMPPALKLIISGWPAVAFLGGTLLVHGKVTETVSTPIEPVDVPHAPSVLPETTWTDTAELTALIPQPKKTEKPAPTMDPEKIIYEGWANRVHYKEVAEAVGKAPSTIYRRFRKLDAEHAVAA